MEVGMSPTIAIVSGVTLLTIVGIESGGAFLLRTLRRSSGFTDLQRSFFRAGHAHAGVLVILGLTVLLLLDAVGVNATLQWSGVGVLASAILLPAGFFLSVLGPHASTPGPLVGLIWAGAAVLALSLVVAAVAIVVAGVAGLA